MKHSHSQSFRASTITLIRHLRLIRALLVFPEKIQEGVLVRRCPLILYNGCANTSYVGTRRFYSNGAFTRTCTVGMLHDLRLIMHRLINVLLFNKEKSLLENNQRGVTGNSNSLHIIPLVHN